MVLSDLEIYRNLVPDSKIEELFVDRQLRYVSEINRSSSSDTIQIDTRYTVNDFTYWGDSYLVVPLKVVVGEATKKVDKAAAFKQSLLSLIQSFELTINGQTIANSNDIHYYNNLLLMLEKSEDWMKHFGDQLHFYKNETPSSRLHIAEAKDKSGVVAASNSKADIDTALAAVVSKIDSLVEEGSSNTGFVAPSIYTSNNYNGGLYKRMAYLSAAGTTTYEPTITINSVATTYTGQTWYEFDAKIPLKYIHSVFRELNFPLTNCSMKMNFNTIMRTSESAVFVLPQTAAVAAPKITLNGEVKLYYENIVFTESQAKEVAALLEAGFSKKFSYTEIEVKVDSVPTTETSIKRLLSSGTAMPTRIFCMMFKDRAGHESLEPGVTTGGFKSANIYLDNQPYYEDRLEGYKFYEILRQQMPFDDDNDSKCLLPYFYWDKVYRVHCFDIMRLQHRVNNSERAVNIRLEAEKIASTDVLELVTIIERTQAVDLQFKSGSVVITRGTSL